MGKYIAPYMGEYIEQGNQNLESRYYWTRTVNIRAEECTICKT